MNSPLANSSNICKNSVCKMELEKIRKTYQKKLHAAVRGRRRLENKLEKVETLEQQIRNILKSNSTISEIILSQIRRYNSKRRKLYTSEEKNIALSVYYSVGSHGYKYENDTHILFQHIDQSKSFLQFLLHFYRALLDLGLRLPSLCSIHNWMKKFEFKTGVNKQIVEFLKMKVPSMSKEDKECVLMWDEMAIKEYLEYDRNSDSLSGISDFGENNRELECANEALVFMIQGVYSNWKLSFSYYFSASCTTSEMLKTKVLENLEAVLSTGLKVRACVCDMSFTNQGLYRLLGCKTSNPYITVNGCQIYLLYDFPHLLKLIRNNLLKRYFIITDRRTKIEKNIKWAYINQFRRRDRNCALRMAPKLTQGHFKLKDYSKMKVKLAAQVLSHSVYAGMMTMIRMKRLKKEARDTAFFVRDVDSMFDLCNVSKFSDKKPGKSAIAVLKNIDKFEKYINLFKSLKVTGLHGDQSNFRKGLIQTLSGLRKLAIRLKSEGYHTMYTRRFQQDSLENYFSIVRAKGGWCKNPTTRQFRENFKFLFFQHLLKPKKKGNCEDTNSHCLIQRVEFENFIHVRSEAVGQTVGVAQTGTSVACPLSKALFHQTFSRLETKKVATEHNKQVALYVGSYCVKKIILKSKCVNCKRMLATGTGLSISKQNSLLIEKSYSLKAIHNIPSDLEYNSIITDANLTIFLTVGQTFKSVLLKTMQNDGLNCLKNVTSYLINSSDLLKQWLNADGCVNHRKSMLKLYLIVLMFRTVKDKNDKIRVSKSWEQTRRQMRNQ
jgi:hypothetical protein